ncbi:hypothetical protein BGZ60DRAFT_570086, partial [Tricladium varicosporioides]
MPSLKLLTLALLATNITAFALPAIKAHRQTAEDKNIMWLVNCQKDNAISSAVAYFSSSTDTTPDAVAVTARGKNTQWEEGVVSAEFESGNSFTVNIQNNAATGVERGNLAGSASDDYKSYECFK